MLSYSTIVAVYGILMIIFTLISMMCKYKVYDLTTLPPGATPRSYFGPSRPLTPQVLEAKIILYSELIKIFSTLACFSFMACVVFMVLSSMKEGRKMAAGQMPVGQMPAGQMPRPMMQPMMAPQPMMARPIQPSTTSEYTM
jgi:hypothetical protein